MKLLPCPFCGVEPKIVHIRGDRGYSNPKVKILCNNCKCAETPTSDEWGWSIEKGNYGRDLDALNDVVKLWNNRKEPK